MGLSFQPEKMARLLNELFVRNVTVKIGPPASANSMKVTAAYTSDNDALVAVCV